MTNHFYGAYHWDFHPVEDRFVLLDALELFCGDDANLFIESVCPSLLQRFRFWRMRSSYRTRILPDILSPRPAVFHLKLRDSTLRELKRMLIRDGMNERSIAHIKGYSGDRGLFWFHGFCDQGDTTLSCSWHVAEAVIDELELRLGVKAEKKFGELKTDRERKEEILHILDAVDRLRE